MGRLSQTQYILRRTPERVRITRHAHPLRGRELDVLMDGAQCLVVRLDNGTSMRIPRAWTDADGVAAEPQDLTVFTTESLRRVLDLADAFLRRA